MPQKVTVLNIDDIIRIVKKEGGKEITWNARAFDILSQFARIPFNESEIRYLGILNKKGEHLDCEYKVTKYDDHIQAQNV